MHKKILIVWAGLVTVFASMAMSDEIGGDRGLIVTVPTAVVVTNRKGLYGTVPRACTLIPTRGGTLQQHTPSKSLRAKVQAAVRRAQGQQKQK